MRMHQHKTRSFVRDDYDLEAAAAVVRQVFEGVPGKRLRTDRTSISRAAHGSPCNPLHRLRRWARRAAENGVPRERAELLAIEVRAAIEAAYGPVVLDWREALRREHRADVHEDAVQYDAYDDPSLLSEWLARAKAYRATLDVAIAAVEHELMHQRAKAA